MSFRSCSNGTFDGWMKLLFHVADLDWKSVAGLNQNWVRD